MKDQASPGTGTHATLRVVRTDAHHPALEALLTALDKDLAIRDGAEHAFFAGYNKLAGINHVVLAMDGDEAVGCGAFKAFGDGAVEIKRMYTPPSHRQRGIGSLVLGELERWATEIGHHRCVLETGRKMTEAIALYGKLGYRPIPNYGQYAGVESCVCFEKQL